MPNARAQTHPQKTSNKYTSYPRNVPRQSDPAAVADACAMPKKRSPPCLSLPEDGPEPLSLIAPISGTSIPSDSTVSGSSDSFIGRSNVDGVERRPVPPARGHNLRRLFRRDIQQDPSLGKDKEIILDANAEWASFLVSARSSRMRKMRGRRKGAPRQPTTLDLTASFLMGQASDVINVRTSQLMFGGVKSIDSEAGRDEFLRFLERKNRDQRQDQPRWKRWLQSKGLFTRRKLPPRHSTPMEARNITKSAPPEESASEDDEISDAGSVIRLSLDDCESDRLSVASSVEVVELPELEDHWNGREFELPSLSQLAL